MLLPTASTLSLAEQVAQMIVVRASGFLFDHQIQYPAWEPPSATLRRWVQEMGVGGVLLLGGSAVEVKQRSQQLQDWATVPLLVAADIEEGVGQRFAGATWFPPPMALSAIAQQDWNMALAAAEQMGRITAEEALAIGLNWLLAPVVDVNNNAQNPVINVRSFGESPEVVSQLTTAFLRGAQQHSALTTAKHFPGHGDTAVDSHLELPVLPHSIDRLAAVELLPFKSAIAAGVDAVMTAHLQIPSLDPDYPATLSSRVLTTLLRQQLGFEGLIVTDALVMGAIADRYGANEAAVLAVEAGADIVLMPADPEGAIQAICAAVEQGRLAPHQIQASIDRIWRAKEKACAARIDSPETFSSAASIRRLATPIAQTLAAEITERSLQVRCLQPLHPAAMDENAWNLVIVDDLVNCPFLGVAAPAIALPRMFNYSLKLIDRQSPFDLSLIEARSPTLLQLFIRGNPFRGSAGLTQVADSWFQALLKAGNLRGLAVYGSPYAQAHFQQNLPPEIPCVFSYGQMPSAQAIALESLFGQSVRESGDRRFTD